MQLETPAFGQQKSPINRAFRGTYLFYVPVMVGEDGFEPSKSETTDLQSAPFGHSGILPYLTFHKCPNA